jgi:hypothetical protein
MNTALLLLPDFALILLGAAIRRWMHLGDHFWNGVEKLVYFILFPALLINAIVNTRLDLAAALPLIATAFAAMAGGMLLAGLGGWFAKLPALRFASLFQCAYRFNSYIALAVAGMLFGAPGIATMGLVVGIAVPFANLVSVWMLARHGETSLWREIARNPLIWGTATGFLLNLAGFVPPAPMQAFLGRLADASIALGLITVGLPCAWITCLACASFRYGCWRSNCSPCRWLPSALAAGWAEWPEPADRRAIRRHADGFVGLHSGHAHGRRRAQRRLADLGDDAGLDADAAVVGGVGGSQLFALELLAS